MTRKFAQGTLALLLCLFVSLAYGQGRGKETKKPGGEKPGGESKNERKPETKPGKEQPGRGSAGKPEPKEGAKSGGNNPGGAWGERSHAGKQAGEKSGNEGAKGIAAGEAAAKNKTPQNAGAKGAVAGETAAKNKSPQATGAESAAAGAAVSKRNSPQATGAQGAAAGAAVTKRNEPGASGAAGYAAVRNSFHQPNLYGSQWYGNHPGAWSAAGWAAGTAWTAASWNAMSSFGGYGNATPISYNYGDNVTYQNGNVLVDDRNAGTADEFSQQAASLAQKGVNAQVSDTEEWLPVGVFALVRNENQHPQVIIQLALDKQGILRGNYTDEVSGHTMPIQGAVDEQTQRAAWVVAGNMQSVTEAGLHNLTESEAPVLIHRNGKTDHWILVRLSNDSAAADAEK